MTDKTYENVRKSYPVFLYKNYSLTRDDNNIYISYDFETAGLTTFRPEIRIDTTNLPIINDFDSPLGKKIIFNLGMVEAVSYLKATCSPEMRVGCGFIDEEDKLWWKKLYFGGLGEFFYKNNINADFDSFLTISCAEKKDEEQSGKINLGNTNIVPVGGGKDSAVTAEIIKKSHPDILFFTVNSQQARTDTVLSAGYTEDSIIKTYRKISPELLELNKQGFFNGHTPFSAIVAFLSFYCAYLTGSKNIILSNEASANESNIKDSLINHQYSKSYEFERDFTDYAAKNMVSEIRYFSVLRPFNELQIAKEFCRHEEYLYKFRSCNAGSKKNIWCCNCPKCLFVYSILSAFLSQEKLTSVFGVNMLDKSEMEKDFDGLVGLSPVKPFECVGTVSEIKFALATAYKKITEQEENVPYLLKKFAANFDMTEILKQPLLKEFNGVHNIPDEFMNDVKEMYDYVCSGSC